MSRFMTNTTKGNNVKDVFFIISSWMVKVFAIIVTIKAFLGSCRKNETCLNCPPNINAYSAVALGLILATCILSFCAVSIFLADCEMLLFTVWCMAIFTFGCFVALLTPVMISMLTRLSLVKFRDRLNRLAFAASFFYNGFRHNRFSIKRLLLEPFAGNIPQVACSILSTTSPMSRRIP